MVSPFPALPREHLQKLSSLVSGPQTGVIRKTVFGAQRDWTALYVLESVHQRFASLGGGNE